MELKSAFDRIQEFLDQRKRKVVITTHRSPDGDAIGSSLAMYLFLKELGHEPIVIPPNDYPEFFHWLPGHEEVLVYDQNPEKAKQAVKDTDIILCLDFNMLARLEEFKPVVEASEAPKAIIDHHPSPGEFADHVASDPKASSTAQLVYEFFENWGMKDRVTKEVAECLYVGIMTDTGSFRFSSTSPRTHRIAAELIEKGIDGADIQNKVFDNNSLDQLRLNGYVLSEKLQVIEEFKASVISLSLKELERFRAKKGYTEGFVNQALSVKGVKVAAFFTEMEQGAKISFRSKGDFSVNELAREHFNGGGHLNAAGGRTYEPLDDAVQRFISILPQYKEELCD